MTTQAEVPDLLARVERLERLVQDARMSISGGGPHDALRLSDACRGRLGLLEVNPKRMRELLANPSNARLLRLYAIPGKKGPFLFYRLPHSNRWYTTRARIDDWKKSFEHLGSSSLAVEAFIRRVDQKTEARRVTAGPRKGEAACQREPQTLRP